MNSCIDVNGSLKIYVNCVQFGLINTSLVAMDAMSKAKGGKGGVIVNIASIAGFTVTPGIPVYNATKHGVVAFTRSMSVG